MIAVLSGLIRTWHAWRAHRLTKRAERAAAEGRISDAFALRLRIQDHEIAADRPAHGEGLVTRARPPN